jgi:hypothetical protein
MAGHPRLAANKPSRPQQQTSSCVRMSTCPPNMPAETQITSDTQSMPAQVTRRIVLHEWLHHPTDCTARAAALRRGCCCAPQHAASGILRTHRHTACGRAALQQGPAVATVNHRNSRTCEAQVPKHLTPCSSAPLDRGSCMEATRMHGRANLRCTAPVRIRRLR